MQDKMSVEEDCLKLSEMAKKAGVSASTVYDYLRYGILPPPVRTSPTKSFFTQKHLERLYEVRTLRSKGLSINDIRDSLGCNNPLEIKASDSNDSIRIEIIDKALELFSKYHYEKTKVVDITNALNIGSGTFYRYFKSKEELFLGCLERLPVVLVPDDAWNKVEEETDFILRLKKRGYAMLNAFPSYIGILNYAKQALGGDDEILARKAAECINTLITPLKRDLERAINQGKVRKKIDVEMCAHLLLGINETFGYRTLIDPDYSIEYGFGVIEDFINHALSVKDDINNWYNYSCRFVDISDNEIILESVAFENSSNFFSGKYLNGELQISFDDIRSLSVEDSSGLYSAYTRLNNSDIIDVKIDGDDLFSGVASFGKFSIKVKNIKTVDSFHKSQHA